jgi:hypothetical protein
MYDNFVRDRMLVYLKKNKDYGDSFVDSINALGETAGLVRILDKVNRLKSLLKQQESEVSESLQDTVLDLFNYVVMFECAKECTNNLLDILEGMLYLAEHHKEFAEIVNTFFISKHEHLCFTETECKQVNDLLWGYVVSLV